MLPFLDAITAIFTRESGRLWNVVVPPHVYTRVLALLRAHGSAGPAPRPVWVFVSPYREPTGGWTPRLREIAREHPQGSAPILPDDAGQAAEPREIFARALAACAPAELVVVLAPQHVDDARAYAADLEALVVHPDLRGVRWVVMDAIHSSLGDLGGAVRRIVQPALAATDERELDRVLGDLEAESAQLSPELDARLAADSWLRAPEAAALRRTLREADRSGESGDHENAVRCRSQAEAELAARGLAEEAVHVGMQRARSLVAAGAAEEGQRVFVAALREAERRSMRTLIPEAYASLGSLHSSQQRFVEATEAYTRAAQLAEQRGSRALAADTRRCAGHAALNASMPDAAIDAWTRAFTLLDATAPPVASLEEPRQLAVLGVTLAEVFEERGNIAAAQALRGHAAAIERRNPQAPGSFS